MEMYEIFKSEGGYRVCGGVWCGGPIMKKSPYFRTLEEAKKAAVSMRKKDEENMNFLKEWTCYQ